jgi:hypothetical protein
MDPRFQYRGSLSETPLAKMLATIHRYRVPGVLTATRAGAIKRVFLEDGRVVFATSSDMEDALGAFLVSRGVLTAGQVQETSVRIAETGKRQGEVLIDMGILSRAQMAGAVLAQVANILWSLFRWEDGEVSFEVGRFRAEETIQMDFSLAQVIREGILKHTDAKLLVHRIGPSWTVLEIIPEAAAPPIELLPAEIRYLADIDGKTPFVDLCRKGPGDASDNARILFLFFSLDLIRRKAEPTARKIQWRTSQPGDARKE